MGYRECRGAGTCSAPALAGCARPWAGAGSGAASHGFHRFHLALVKPNAVDRAVM